MEYKNPYVLDLDENRMVKLTKKNVDFIRGILKIDSSYRREMDVLDDTSAAYYIKNHPITNGSNSYEDIEEIVKRIDRENSTHISVSGTEKGGENNGDGVRIVTEGICKMLNLKDSLENGNFNVVVEISRLVKGRNNFSFASKFCAYVSRYTFGETKCKYCIYDDVLSKILPYYAFKYLGRYYIKRTNSSIISEFKDKRDYEGYRDLINEIIEAVFKETGYKLSYEDFDHLLWYYYKGDNILIKKALDIVRTNRINK